MSSHYSPMGFQILPPVIKNLLIINGLTFFATFVLNRAGLINLEYYLGLFHWESPLFQPWQLITHVFMHADFMHLFFNMFALWMFGNVFENMFGAKRFLIFYFVCAFGAAFLHMIVFNWENAVSIHEFSKIPKDHALMEIKKILNTGMGDSRTIDMIIPMIVPTVGASGAVYGLLFAYGYLFPNQRIYLYFLFPIKAKFFVAILAAVALFSGFANHSGDNIAHFAHLGGMIFAFLLLRYWRKTGQIYRIN